MCGICGICNSQDPFEDVRIMEGALNHRGPDDGGEYIEENARIALGHRRLAIIDLSNAAHQPMLSSNERYVIAFNGEIYNFCNLKRMLPEGVRNGLRSSSDTEVLLEMFQVYGIEETLSRARGMFAIALFDRQEKTLFLIRDRAGEKPLYYGFLNQMFVFSSELKSIQEVARKNNISLQINSDAIKIYLRHSYIPAPYSIYEHIYKVEAASIVKVVFPYSEIKFCERYWNLEANISPLNISRKDAREELKNFLMSAISEQMVADVPYGAFLSGGIDSSLIVSYMQKKASQAVKTFSIGFQSDKYNEAPFAKNIAKYLGCDHEELYVTDKEAMDVIPLLPQIYDEPYADSSQIPTYLVSKLAKESVTVALTGDAGDELFCGYEHYLNIASHYSKMKKIPSGIRIVLGKMFGNRAFEWLNSKTFNNKIYKLSRTLCADNQTVFFYEMIRADNARESLMGTLSDREYFCALDKRLPFKNFICNMQFIDFNTYLTNDILVKVDRASMYHSLETRVPFLDRRIIEFAYSIPLEYKLNGSETKSILRDLLYAEVPKELLDRPKWGFGVPLDDWLRGPLKQWAEELIYSDKLKKLSEFNHKQAVGIWNKHLTGKFNYQTILWNVIMLSLWLNNKA